MTSKALALIQLRSSSIMKYLKHNLASTAIRLLIALAVLLTVALTSVSVKAQCPTTVLASNLRAPTKIILSQNGNLLVAEQGNGPNTGRISILDPNSRERRTLLDGLPSANAEKTASGFTLTEADQIALQSGAELVLDNGKGDKLTIKLLADFPNVVPAPRPDLPDNTVSSNPFGVAVNNNLLYVVDASLNFIWTVELSTGATAILTTFAPLTTRSRWGHLLLTRCRTASIYSAASFW